MKQVTTKYSKNQLNIFPDESLCFHESVNEENMQGLVKVCSELEIYALDFKFVNPLCLQVEVRTNVGIVGPQTQSQIT